MPFQHEVFAQFVEVLDDAIVNHSDIVRTARVGVRIALTWRTMRCPACVANAARAQAIIRTQRCDQFGNLALPAHDLYFFAIEYSDARRIIASIFKMLKAIDQDALSLLRSGVTDDSTHAVVSFSSALMRIFYNTRTRHCTVRHLSVALHTTKEREAATKQLLFIKP